MTSIEMENTLSIGLESLLNRNSNSSTPKEQKTAIDLLRKNGLSTQKDEDWKYTNLRWLNNHSFHDACRVSVDKIEQWIDQHVLNNPNFADLPRLVFANGLFCSELSTALKCDKLNILPDSDFFGVLARPDREKMATLNYAMQNKSQIIHVPAGTQAGQLLIVNLGLNESNEYFSFHPRFIFTLEENSQLSIIELNIGEGNYFQNPLYEFCIDSHVKLSYMRVLDESKTAFHYSTLYAALADHTKIDTFLLTLGGAITRQEIYVKFLGEWGNLQLQAIQKLAQQQHGDLTFHIKHMVPHCQSLQNVKNILTDHARGVYQGKIFVDRIAQKTDGQQQSQALLLSDNAEIDTKPELEIYADDVKCTHGATVGALDKEQLFFLMARGIPHEQAREILVNAFLNETLEMIQDPVNSNMMKHYLSMDDEEGAIS